MRRFSEQQLRSDFVVSVNLALPAERGWRLWFDRHDDRLRITPPGGKSVFVPLQVRTNSDQRFGLLEALVGNWGPKSGSSGVLVCPFVPERARAFLAERGFGYWDPTGNMLLQLRDPAVFIERTGASSNPWIPARELRSLKGASAGRAVRALCDFKPQYTVGELSARSATSLATIVRVVQLAEREGLLERAPRGPIERVDWRGLIQRWAKDYSLLESNLVRSYIEPRGRSEFLRKLTSTKLRYAATGSIAAELKAPVSGARLFAVYVADMRKAAEQLELVETDEGANTLLIEPFDAVALERTWKADVSAQGKLECSSLAQVAVDLATSPGRGPEDAVTLLDWMERHEDEWRT